MGNWMAVSYREGDETKIARLASVVYPNLNVEEYAQSWRMKYLRSPEGFASWLAVDNDEVVGHYGAIMSRARLGGKDLMVAQAVDAFVHPKWRRHGIFVGLGRAILKDLGERGAHLTYGVPNKAAMPGHKRLSWSIVAEIPRYILIVDRKKAIDTYKGRGFKRFALNVMAALMSRPRSQQIPEGFHKTDSPTDWSVVEGLWQRSREGYDFALDRSKRHLAWRYPVGSNRNYMIAHREHESEAKAASVFRVGSGQMGQIAELIALAGRQEDSRLLLRGVVTHLARSGCHTVEALAPTRELRRLFRSEGFMKVSRVPLIAHASDTLGTEQLRALMGARRIMLSYGDSDLV